MIQYFKGNQSQGLGCPAFKDNLDIFSIWSPD